jgi:hypothetical protein
MFCSASENCTGRRVKHSQVIFTASFTRSKQMLAFWQVWTTLSVYQYFWEYCCWCCWCKGDEHTPRWVHSERSIPSRSRTKMPSSNVLFSFLKRHWYAMCVSWRTIWFRVKYSQVIFMASFTRLKRMLTFWQVWTTLSFYQYFWESGGHLEKFKYIFKSFCIRIS